MNHAGLLKRAFNLTFSNWVFWPFAASAAFLTTILNIGNLFMTMAMNRNPGEPSPFLKSFVLNPNPKLFIAAPLVFLLFIILMVVVTMFSDGAIIGLIHNIENQGNASLQDGLEYGWKNCFYLIAIDLLLWLPVMFIFGGLFIAMMIMFFGAAMSDRTQLFIPLMMVAAIIFLVLYLAIMIFLTNIHMLSHRVRVIEEKDIFASIRRAYGLFKPNMADSIIIWLLTMAVTFAIFILVMISNIMTPQAVMIAKGWPLPLYAAHALLLMTAWATSNIFLSNIWTLFYEALAKKTESSKISPSSEADDLPIT